MWNYHFTESFQAALAWPFGQLFDYGLMWITEPYPKLMCSELFQFLLHIEKLDFEISLQNDFSEFIFEFSGDNLFMCFVLKVICFQWT